MNYSFEFKVDYFLNDFSEYFLKLSEFDYDLGVDYCLNVYLSPLGGVDSREHLCTFDYKIYFDNRIEIENFLVVYREFVGIYSKIVDILGFYEIYKDKDYIMDIREGLLYYNNIYFSITEK